MHLKVCVDYEKQHKNLQDAKERAHSVNADTLASNLASVHDFEQTLKLEELKVKSNPKITEKDFASYIARTD